MSDVPLYRMYVGGEYVPAASGKTFEVENPATREIIANVSEGDKEDIDNAVRIAFKAFGSWGKTSGEERATILGRAAEILADRLDEFVRLEADQTGRPYREMSAQVARDRKSTRLNSSHANISYAV